MAAVQASLSRYHFTVLRKPELWSCFGVQPSSRLALAFDAPRFHEAVLLLDRPVAPVLEALARRGIRVDGVARHHPVRRQLAAGDEHQARRYDLRDEIVRRDQTCARMQQPRCSKSSMWSRK